MSSLTTKLDEYCNEIRFRLTSGNPGKVVEVGEIRFVLVQNQMCVARIMTFYYFSFCFFLLSFFFQFYM